MTLANGSKMTGAAKLRSLLAEGPLLAAGCHDPISARLAEVAGFAAVNIDGLGLSITMMGAPDIGLFTMTEVVANAARVTAAIGVPAICDIDTGFGGVHQIARTIREIERVGVAAVKIEDQANPKRCPLGAERVILSPSEAVDRVKVAVAARSDPDFVIVGRSDADEISFDELVRRCNLYLEAGADVAQPVMWKLNGELFPYLPATEQMKWYRKLAKEIDGPLLTLRPPPGCTADDMFDAGFAIVDLSSTGIMASASAMLAAYREEIANGKTDGYFQRVGPPIDMLELFKMVRLDEFNEFEGRFGPLV